MSHKFSFDVKFIYYSPELFSFIASQRDEQIAVGALLN